MFTLQPAGARLVRAPALRDVADAADQVVRGHHTLAVCGEIGAGKTVAVRHYLDQQTLPVVPLDLSPRMRAKELNQRLYRQLVADEDHPQRDLQDDLVACLAEQPRIVLVRHAQRLNADTAGQLQWLHERPNHQWALILVGDPRAAAAIDADAELRRSIVRWVPVKPLTRDQVLELIPTMHGVLAQASAELLAEIDDRRCYGVLGNWAAFLRSVLHLRQKVEALGRTAPILDRDFAAAALEITPPAHKPRNHH